jgi:hypothetical protein
LALWGYWWSYWAQLESSVLLPYGFLVSELKVIEINVRILKRLG